MKRWASIMLVGLLSLAAATGAHGATSADGGGSDLPEGWYARIETTLGAIVVRLLPEQSPESVAHFAALAEGRLEWNDPVTGEPKTGPYYDGAPVTRAQGAALFQVGETSAQGTFAPFLYVPAKPTQDVNFNLAWRMGNVRVGPKVSAARWLITAGAMPGFNGTVPCFGVVVEGFETVFQLTSVKTHDNGHPIDPILVKAVRIFSVGEPEPLPQPVPYVPDTPTQTTIEMRDDPSELRNRKR